MGVYRLMDVCQCTMASMVFAGVRRSVGTTGFGLEAFAVIGYETSSLEAEGS